MGEPPLLLERPLPRAQRVLGWALILAAPVASVVGPGGLLYLLGEELPTLERLAAELPVEADVRVWVTAAFCAALFGPGLSVVLYLRALRRRYGRCRVAGGRASFSGPFGLSAHLALEELTRRRVTRHGLLLKHPHFGGWLLAPAEGEAAAGALAGRLDELCQAGPRPPSLEPPEGSAVEVTGRQPTELALSWPLIRAEKVPALWGLAIVLLPACGAGLLLVPGLLLNGRRRNQLVLTPERLQLFPGAPFAGFRRDLTREQVARIEDADLMAWARVGGQRLDLLDAAALGPDDAVWLIDVLRAWHSGALWGRGGE